MSSHGGGRVRRSEPLGLGSSSSRTRAADLLVAEVIGNEPSEEQILETTLDVRGRWARPRTDVNVLAVGDSRVDDRHLHVVGGHGHLTLNGWAQTGGARGVSSAVAEWRTGTHQFGQRDARSRLGCL
jgi:hypothetical protein